MFTDFYTHRILRIFPALIITLFLVLLVGWFLFLPDEYAQLGKHVMWSAGFSENFNLWKESGYFDVAAEKKASDAFMELFFCYNVVASGNKIGLI